MFIRAKPKKGRRKKEQKKGRRTEKQVATSNKQPGGIKSKNFIDPDTGIVKPMIRPEQLLSVKIIRKPGDTADNKTNKIKMQITCLPEELIQRRFEKIEITYRNIPIPSHPVSTPQEVTLLLNQRMYTSPDKVIQTIDIKEGVDAFKFEALNGKEALGPQKDYAKIRPTVSKVRKKIESKFIRSSVSALPQEPEFIDSTGKLEERLGGEASETTNTAETSADVDETQILAEIRSVYSAEPEEKGASSKKERELIPEPMIDKVMNAKEFNRANRRPFPGITVKEMMKGSVDPGRQKSSINFKVIKKRPKVKGLKTKREPI